MILSGLTLYGSLVYLSIILSSYVRREFDWHLGIFSGIAFVSVVSMIFGYIVLSLAIRMRSDDTN